ncbi:hypothetical protein [Vibrio vulnificus YJ016]|uniref:Uncharacterized protein n=1 Tax=Vibrio vulnificus (strain YJ016) TaxID=196600 RepID=Q7MKI1_VIBVY|nr:hypothetical protein [Vibrio vulnificus YJ016]
MVGAIAFLSSKDTVATQTILQLTKFPTQQNSDTSLYVFGRPPR